MKLLLFSDVHLDREAAAALAAASREADVVVGAGDYASFRRNLSDCIQALAVIDTPTVLVCGNHESAAELTAACDSVWPAATVLHGQQTTLAGITFFGLGGAVPVTPFGPWSVDLTEAEARAELASMPAGCVLVTHAPPYDCLDALSGGERVGCQAVRAAIEHARPALAVCGHIHEHAGQRATIGQTTVVNAGPHGVLLDLPATA